MKFEEVLINPRLPEDQIAFIRSNLPVHDFPEHIWIASSGSKAKTPHDHKFIALSKKAIVASAAAVNQHLTANAQDVWLSSLPSFHVGGLGIHARAYLTDSRIVSLEKWDPQQFTALIKKEAVTLTSLVPAQVFDLVAQRLQAPQSLRAIIVGGGALSPILMEAAQKLGWPLLHSYGLTECSSQVATATQDHATLQLLSHIEAKIIDGKIALKSPALLSAYALLSTDEVCIVDPKVDGWYITQDCGEILGKTLQLHGRQDDFIKIGGESVMLSRLQELFEQAKLKSATGFDAAIFPMPDERLGTVIHMATTSTSYETLSTAYNASVLPFERIRKVHVIPEIPRSPLKKLLLPQLLKLTT